MYFERDLVKNTNILSDPDGFLDPNPVKIGLGSSTLCL